MSPLLVLLLPARASGDTHHSSPAQVCCVALGHVAAHQLSDDCRSCISVHRSDWVVLDQLIPIGHWVERPTEHAVQDDPEMILIVREMMWWRAEGAKRLESELLDGWSRRHAAMALDAVERGGALEMGHDGLLGVGQVRMSVIIPKTR